MTQVSDEVDMVFELLASVEEGISYNDGTGVRQRDIEIEFDVPTADVETGAQVPAEVAKALILPALEEEFAEQELTIRSAVVHRSVFMKSDYNSYMVTVTV